MHDYWWKIGKDKINSSYNNQGQRKKNRNTNDEMQTGVWKKPIFIAGDARSEVDTKPKQSKIML